MAQFSDLTQQVFARAIQALSGRISEDLEKDLQDLLGSGQIKDARSIGVVIAKEVDTEAARAN